MNMVEVVWTLGVFLLGAAFGAVFFLHEWERSMDDADDEADSTDAETQEDKL